METEVICEIEEILAISHSDDIGVSEDYQPLMTEYEAMMLVVERDLI